MFIQYPINMTGKHVELTVFLASGAVGSFPAVSLGETIDGRLIICGSPHDK